MQNRPGGALARRELHFVWLLDTSGSMNADGKMQALNVAIREALPQLAAAAHDHPEVDVRVRAITFGDGARWHVEAPTPVDALRWTDLRAHGHTDLGAALRLTADALKTPPMPPRAVAPVLVLVTDGHHTDDFDAGLQALLAQRWGRDAVRLAIAIGRDVNIAALERFIGDPQVRPVEVDRPEALIERIRWVSSSALASQLRAPRDGAGAPATHGVPGAPDDAW